MGVAQNRRSIGAGYRLEAYATLLLGLAYPERETLRTAQGLWGRNQIGKKSQKSDLSARNGGHDADFIA